MSLILEALNRSRQDADVIPGLGSEHFADSPSAVRRYGPWIGLLLAVLIIVWLLFAGDGKLSVQESSEEVVMAPVAQLSKSTSAAAGSADPELKSRANTAGKNTPAEKPVPKSPATAAQVKSMPVKKPAVQPAGVTKNQQAQQVAPVFKPKSSKAAGPSTADQAALEALYARSRQATQKKPQASAPADQPAKPVPQATAKARTKANPAAPAAAPQSQQGSLDVEAVLRIAEQEAANAKLENHSAPFLVRLSQQVKNDIPSVMYQRHDYSSNRGQSKVTLNGKTLRVGGAPTSGMRVDEILEDSVVLTYRGTQFRLRALNSWVNL
ncbi:MAG: general secretion pathway protein B [Bacteroidia bacterium]